MTCTVEFHWGSIKAVLRSALTEFRCHCLGASVKNVRRTFCYRGDPLSIGKCCSIRHAHEARRPRYKAIAWSGLGLIFYGTFFRL
jgi:hypothetical protein